MSSRSSLLLRLAPFVLFAIAGCTDQTTGPADDLTPLDPVTDLRAFAAGANSVGLAWLPSGSVSSTDAQDHLIRVVSAGVVAAETSAAISASEIVVTGVTEGAAYGLQVIVRAKTSPATAANSPAVTITWAPARRLTVVAGGQPIRVYESSSPGNPSGLIFFKSSIQEPVVTSVQNPVPLNDTLLIDVFVQSQSSTSVLLRSADTYSGRQLPRRTVFSSIVRNTDALDDPALLPPDALTYIDSNTSVLLTNVPEVVSRILFFRTDDAHYGRLLIRRQANGTLIGGTSPNRYCEFEISYQTAAGLLYSRTR